MDGFILCVVFRVDSEKKRIAMSLRPSNTTQKLLYSDIKIGQKIRGNIKRIESFGLFIRIKNSSCDGLCHIAEVRLPIYFKYI